jgi:omega-6 fatty acid desaturase (delta-12 desaturase)
LEACHQQNQHLLQNVPTLTLGTMLQCSKFLLWDPAKLSLAKIPTQNQPSTI